MLLGIIYFNPANGQSCTVTITPDGPTKFCPPGSVTLQANASEVGWTQKADLPGTSERGEVGFSILGKGYVGTGILHNWASKEFWEFDPVANTWTQKADFGGEARGEAAGFSVNGKGYIGTGLLSTGKIANDMWEYDPVANRWSRKADLPGLPRRYASVFTVGSRAFLACGFARGTLLKEVWEYDAQLDQWIQKEDFPGTARWSASAFAIGGMGYLGTGLSNPGGIHVKHTDFWQYDPVMNKWTQKADFGGISQGMTAGFSISNKGYIGSGTLADYILSFWEYDPGADSWEKKADLLGKGYPSYAFSLGNKGYVGFGQESGIDHLYEFNPAPTSTFLWSTGETTPSIVATQSGAYTVTVFDEQGCSATSEPIIVNASPLPAPTIAASGSTNLCEGGQVMLTANPPGKSEDFTYLWSNGESTPSITVKTNGSFNVSISNAQGCTATSASTEVKVGAPFPAPIITANGTTTFCEGRTVSLSVNNFWENDPAGSTSADYTYLWSNGETTPSIVVGTGGIYTLRVTNATGCSQVSAPVEVKVESVPIPKITSNRIPTGVEGYWFCQGETIDFTAIPGTPDPGTSYLWSTGETTQTITVGEDRQLYVTTTDQNGCSATSGYVYAYMEPTPEQPGAYTVPPDCSGKNGFIGISVQQPGNTSAYTIDGFATSSSGSDFFGLGPGTYLVGVQSFRGCLSEIFPITLEAPEYSEVQVVCQPGLEVSADEGACSADVVVNPPSASGGCGELTVTSSHPGSSFPVGTTVVTWTVTDSNGETATCEQTVTVTDNTPPTLVCQPDMLLETTSSGEVVHFSPPAGQDNCGQVTVQQTEGPASGSLFPVGKTKISFTATDEARNTTTCSFIITVAKKACITPPTFTLQVTNSSCLGTNTGSIVINASGGTGSYTYSIDNGDTYSQQNSFAGLGAGNYMVRVQSDGCISPARLVSITASASGQLNIICPKDITVQPTSLNGSRVSFAQPRITNDCPGTVVTQTAGPSSGFVFPIGVTKVTFEATNAAGNSSTCSFLVRVLDPYCSGSGNNKKVYVCHKGQTICVSVNALAAHLGHGDKLGQCGNSYAKPVAEPAVPGISVFPNPTKGQFTVQLKNIPAADATLQIVDAMGSIIENRSVKKAAFSSTISVNLKNKASGVYQVRFVSDTEVYTTKVIVE